MLGASRYEARARRKRFELHYHHPLIQPVRAPGCQPRYPPIPEARPNLTEHAEVKEFGFQLHCFDRGCFDRGLRANCFGRRINRLEESSMEAVSWVSIYSVSA
jgi:hypothetical protein